MCLGVTNVSKLAQIYQSWLAASYELHWHAAAGCKALDDFRGYAVSLKIRGTMSGVPIVRTSILGSIIGVQLLWETTISRGTTGLY